MIKCVIKDIEFPEVGNYIIEKFRYDTMVFLSWLSGLTVALLNNGENTSMSLKERMRSLLEDILFWKHLLHVQIVNRGAEEKSGLMLILYSI